MSLTPTRQLPSVSSRVSGGQRETLLAREFGGVRECGCDRVSRKRGVLRQNPLDGHCGRQIVEHDGKPERACR